MLTKRNLLLAGAASFAVAKYGFPIGGVFAQVTPGPVSSLTVTQRVLLDSVLYNDVPAYIAFAQTVAANVRGSDALQKFDSALSQIQQQTTQQLQTSLDQAISKGIAIDCVLQQAASSIPSTLPQLLSATIPDIGLAETITRQVSATLQQGSNIITDISGLLNSQQIQLIPAIPASVADQYLNYGLNLLSSAGGLSSVLANTMTFINSTKAVSQDVQNALKSATSAMNVIAGGISNIGSGSSGDALAYAAAASEIATAVTALGKATGMNPATVAKISESVNVLGSVVSGALAGASFGPIGAAVGAVVGLLGGLFGGSGGSGGDATAQALSQISSQLSQLSQQMAAGFTQLGQQLGALSQQVSDLSQQLNQDFVSLENSIQNVEKAMSNLGANILALATDVIGAQVVSLASNAQNYETEYRKSRLNVSNEMNATRLTLNTNLQQVLALTSSPSRLPGYGFGAPMFVGMSYAGYLSDFATRLTKSSLADSLNLSAIYSGLPNANSAGSPFLSSEVSSLARNLRSQRYGVPLPESSTASTNSAQVGAAVFGALQQQCFANLKSDWKQAPEFAMISSTVLQPAANFKCPNPIAPEDLWLALDTIQNACSEISDTATSADLLQASQTWFAPYLQAHYLLTGQNSLPALLYIRRQVMSALADAAANVFCNPFMAAVDTYRRVVQNKASAGVVFQNNHSTMQMATVAQATQALHYQRSSMPLANVSAVQFNPALPATSSAIALVGQEMQKIILNQSVNPFPLPTSGPQAYLTTSVQYDMSIFAPQLAKVIAEIGGGPASGTPLSNYLTTVRDSCLLLGLIENCVNARLQALQQTKKTSAPGQAPIGVPTFDTWFDGFKEYGTVAAYALAQPLNDASSSSRPIETSRAEIVIRSVLDGTLSVPRPPSSLPGLPQLIEYAKPYPVEFGSFWGWGAEQCRPSTPTLQALVQAILRPQCALAGENSSVLGAVSSFLQLQANLGVLNTKSDLVKLMNRQFPGPNGITQALRAKLNAA